VGLNTNIAELHREVEKFKEDSDLRKGIIAQLHEALKAKDAEQDALRKQLLELEKRLNEYVQQSQSFEVYKVGFHKTPAKVCSCLTVLTSF
jgi:chromosome segregation ATPase